MAKKIDPKAKAKRQKIIAAVGAVILAAFALRVFNRLEGNLAEEL